MRQSKGFTLIEVLAALIIIGLGMLAVIRAVNQTISNTSYLREKSIAHWVAMNKLAETRLSAAPPSNSNSDGDVDMAGVSWHWRITVEQVQPGIQRIDVKVAPKDQGPDASMDTVTGLYGTSFAPGSPTNWDFNAAGVNPNGTNSNSSSSSSLPAKPVVGPLS